MQDSVWDIVSFVASTTAKYAWHTRQDLPSSPSSTCPYQDAWFSSLIVTCNCWDGAYLSKSWSLFDALKSLGISSLSLFMNVSLSLSLSNCLSLVAFSFSANSCKVTSILSASKSPAKKIGLNIICLLRYLNGIIYYLMTLDGGDFIFHLSCLGYTSSNLRGNLVCT